MINCYFLSSKSLDKDGRGDIVVTVVKQLHHTLRQQVDMTSTYYFKSILAQIQTEIERSSKLWGIDGKPSPLISFQPERLLEEDYRPRRKDPLPWRKDQRFEIINLSTVPIASASPALCRWGNVISQVS
jgi:hypothetical protein